MSSDFLLKFRDMRWWKSCGKGYDGDSTFSRAFRHLAPEIQKDGRLAEPTRAGDVYSFGVIVRDLFANSRRRKLQPTTSADASSAMPSKAVHIMELACDRIAIKRPTFDQLEKITRSAIVGGKANLLDRCVRIMKFFVFFPVEYSDDGSLSGAYCMVSLDPLVGL